MKSGHLLFEFHSVFHFFVLQAVADDCVLIEDYKIGVVVPDKKAFLQAVNNSRNEAVKKLISYVIDRSDLQIGLNRLFEVGEKEWATHFAGDKNFLQLR